MPDLEQLDSQAVRASLSQVGHLAAMFPGTQLPIVPDSVEDDDSQPEQTPHAATPEHAGRPAGADLPEWMLGGAGQPALRQEPKTGFPHTGLRTWNRRSRGNQQASLAEPRQHSSVAAAATEQPGASAPAQAALPHKGEAATLMPQPGTATNQGAPAQARPADAFQFPDSEAPAAVPPLEPEPALPSGKASGKAARTGRGKAARGRAATATGPKRVRASRDSASKQLQEQQQEQPLDKGEARNATGVAAPHSDDAVKQVDSTF